MTARRRTVGEFLPKAEDWNRAEDHEERIRALEFLPGFTLPAAKLIVSRPNWPGEDEGYAFGTGLYTDSPDVYSWEDPDRFITIHTPGRYICTLDASANLNEDDLDRSPYPDEAVLIVGISVQTEPDAALAPHWIDQSYLDPHFKQLFFPPAASQTPNFTRTWTADIYEDSFADGIALVFPLFFVAPPLASDVNSSALGIFSMTRTGPAPPFAS